MDEAYYVGFSIEGQEVGLDPHGHSQGMTGPVGYWHVDDIYERLERLLALAPRCSTRSETSVAAS